MKNVQIFHGLNDPDKVDTMWRLFQGFRKLTNFSFKPLIKNSVSLQLNL